MSGAAAALLAVVIWASYPVATRAALVGSFTPQELVTLRFGVGALLFLPYLILRLRAVERGAWLRGVPLTAFQGAGMGALVICGLQFAPANHQAALGPGLSSAWVALLGFLLFARRPAVPLAVGAILCAAGVAVLAWWSATQGAPLVLVGDAMFIAASALGALYVLQLRSWSVNPIEAAAIVTLYSALLVVPWHLCTAAAPLWRVGLAELLWQVLWQGVLIGCLSLVALNHAIRALGAERSSTLIALVPVLTALLAFAFLGEAPSTWEIAAFVAISAGVSLGSLARASSSTEAIPLPLAPERSASRAGYPARDSAR